MAESDESKQVIVEREPRSYSGIIVAVVALILIILFIMYGLPYLSGGSTTNVNVDTPAGQ